MLLEIVTPDEKIFSGPIKLVQVPGTKGQFEVLKNHAPIISTLNAGKIKVIDENDKVIYFTLGQGVIEVNHNKVILLAENA